MAQKVDLAEQIATNSNIKTLNGVIHSPQTTDMNCA